MTTTNSPEAQDGVRCAKCGTVRPMSTLASRDTFVCRKCFSTETEPEAQPPNIKCDRVTCELTRSHLVGDIGCGEEWWYEQQQQAQPQGGGLLPCPFCGDKASLEQDAVVEDGKIVLVDNCWQIRCPSCGCQRLAEGGFSNYSSVKEAVTTWNTRADLPRATADSAEWIAETTAREFVAKSLLPDDSKSLELSRNDYWQRAKGAEMVLKKLRATPRATGDTTVEAALAELREIFPHTFVRVNDTAEYSQATGLAFHVCGVAVGMEAVFHGETLADCMAQVRAATHTEGSEKSLDE